MQVRVRAVEEVIRRPPAAEMAHSGPRASATTHKDNNVCRGHPLPREVRSNTGDVVATHFKFESPDEKFHGMGKWGHRRNINHGRKGDPHDRSLGG